MVDCSIARRLMHLGLDGDLAQTDAEVLELHLTYCEGCQRSMIELDAVDAALRVGMARNSPGVAPISATRRKLDQARIRRSLTTTWFPAAAAFLLVLGGLFLVVDNGRSGLNGAPAVVVSGGEAVHVFEPNQSVSQPGRTGVELKEHTVAWGLSDAPMALRFASGTQVQLSNEAVVRIGRNSLDLFKGDLRADLTGARDSFVVGTPWGKFEARGAVFMVHSDAEDSSAVVRVISGEVRVEQHGWSRVVSAGDQLTLRPDPHRPIAL